MKRFRSDTGAVAVEFALVLIVLIPILMGIVDFGRAYGQKLALADAARVGVRMIAVDDPDPTSKIIGIAGSSGMTPGTGLVILPLPACPPGVSPPAQPVTVTVTYPLRSLSGWFEFLFSGEVLTGKAVMRCGG